jgi:hypothetical protein
MKCFSRAWPIACFACLVGASLSGAALWDNCAALRSQFVAPAATANAMCSLAGASSTNSSATFPRVNAFDLGEYDKTTAVQCVPSQNNDDGEVSRRHRTRAGRHRIMTARDRMDRASPTVGACLYFAQIEAGSVLPHVVGPSTTLNSSRHVRLQI